MKVLELPSDEHNFLKKRNLSERTHLWLDEFLDTAGNAVFF